MGNNTMKDVNIAKLLELFDAIQDFDLKIEQKYYDHYKMINSISCSNSFEGDWADTYKSYLKDIPVKIIDETLICSYTLLVLAQKIGVVFSNIEQDKKGRIESEQLKSKMHYFDERINKWDEIAKSVSQSINKSSKYIPVGSIDVAKNSKDIDVGLKQLKNTEKKIITSDQSLSVQVKKLNQEITALIKYIGLAKKLIYSGGNFDSGAYASCKAKEWYNVYSPDSTRRMELINKEGYYLINKKRVHDDKQLAKGASSDSYGVVGYRSGEMINEESFEHNTWSKKISFSLGRLYYLLHGHKNVKDSGEAELGYFNIDTKAGLSAQYAGMHLIFSAGGAKAKQSARVGDDDNNVEISNKAEFMTSKAELYMETSDKGELKFGYKASGKVADASKSGKSSIFSYSVKGKDDKEGKEFLSFSIDAEESDPTKKGVGKSSAFYFESTKAIDAPGPLQINANTLEVKNVLGIKGGFSITIPTPAFNWHDLSAVDKMNCARARKDITEEIDYVRGNYKKSDTLRYGYGN